MIDLRRLIEDEKEIVTVKWLAVKNEISISEAQEEMNKFWRENEDKNYATAFLVDRTFSNGDRRIAVIPAPLETQDGDKLNVFSMQLLLPIDLQKIARINSQLSLSPRITIPNNVKINRTRPTLSIVDDIKPASIATTNVTTTTPTITATTPTIAITPMTTTTTPTATIITPTTPITTTTTSTTNTTSIDSQKTKNSKKKTPTTDSLKKAKKLPVTSVKKSVDLKKSFQSTLFDTDDQKEGERKSIQKDKITTTINEDRASTKQQSLEIDNQSDKKDTKGKKQPLAKQSIVDFSTEDESEEQDSLDQEVIDSPMEIDPIPEPNEPTIIEAPEMTDMSTTIGPRMKMIKVQKTFMENGYLMTEYVNELVPDDTPDSPPIASIESASKDIPFKRTNLKTNDTPIAANNSTPTAATAATVRKQGSLLSFFKPK